MSTSSDTRPSVAPGLVRGIRFWSGWSGVHRLRSTLWATACAVTAMAATHLTGAFEGVVYLVAFQAVATVGLVWVVRAVWRHRELGWIGLLLVATVVTQYAGDAAWGINALTVRTVQSPTWADLWYLVSYVPMVAAVVLLVRRREPKHDLAAFLDAAMITVGIAVVAYTFLIVDAATSASSTPEKVVSVIYPLCDVLVVGVIARVAVGAGGKSGPVLWLGVATMFLLAADIGLAADVVGGATYGRWIDAAYLMFYLLMGRALQHRDVDRLLEPATSQGDRPGPVRLTALGLGTVLAPLTLLVNEVAGDSLKVRGAAIGAVVLFLLAMMRMSQLIRVVERNSQLLELQARTDALTGLANRRTFDHELARSIDRVRGDPGNRPLSVAMIDLDRFKAFNDSQGHAAGDQLLRDASTVWTRVLTSIAPTATLARYGGEEFAVVFPSTDEGSATAAVGELLSLTPRGQSFSAGVAQWDIGEDSADVLARADLRLYQAKAGGRCRVVGGEPRTEPSFVGFHPG